MNEKSVDDWFICPYNVIHGAAELAAKNETVNKQTTP
jgi:hypothetical protein